MSARVAYLIRHALTELNAAGCLRGHADPPLDDAGRAEAEWWAMQVELEGAVGSILRAAARA